MPKKTKDNLIVNGVKPTTGVTSVKLFLDLGVNVKQLLRDKADEQIAARRAEYKAALASKEAK